VIVACGSEEENLKLQVPDRTVMIGLSDAVQDPYAAAHRTCEGAESTARPNIRDVSKSFQHGGHGKFARDSTRVRRASADSLFLSQTYLYQSQQFVVILRVTAICIRGRKRGNSFLQSARSNHGRLPRPCDRPHGGPVALDPPCRNREQH
jgi:hypothetical protein